MDVYISKWLEGIEDQSERSESLFEGLTEDQLNKKPEPDKWSIGELIDHLIVTNGLYLKILQPVADRSFSGLKGVSWRFIPRKLGKFILKGIEPETRKKMKTTGVFKPTRSSVSVEILEEFQVQQEKLKELVSKLDGISLNTTYIKSPVGGMVIYHVEDALTLILNHERRHLGQAEGLKERWSSEK